MKKKDKEGMIKEYIHIKKGKKVLTYKCTKKVFRSGNAGAIALPEGLIGEDVKVVYEVKDE